MAARPRESRRNKEPPAYFENGNTSGKSMTIYQQKFSYHSFAVANRAAEFICTQPRVLTAVDNAKQMSTSPKYEPFLKLGETIGWSTQFSKQKPKRIGLLSATIGILMMQLQLLQMQKFVICIVSLLLMKRMSVLLVPI